MVKSAVFIAFLCVLTLQTYAAEKAQPTTFFLVRHGQTDWNIEGRLQGQSDVPLNDAGRAEAIVLRETLKGMVFHACFSSDLKRSEETAQILLKSHPIKLTTDARLRERYFGSWEGCFWSELPFEDYRTQTDVENDVSVRERFFSFLDEMANRHPGEKLLIVSHGGVIRNVICHIRSDIGFLFDVKVANMALLEIKGADGHYEIENMQGVIIP